MDKNRMKRGNREEVRKKNKNSKTWAYYVDFRKHDQIQNIIFKVASPLDFHSCTLSALIQIQHSTS